MAGFPGYLNDFRNANLAETNCHPNRRMSIDSRHPVFKFLKSIAVHFGGLPLAVFPGRSELSGFLHAKRIPVTRFKDAFFICIREGSLMLQEEFANFLMHAHGSFFHNFIPIFHFVFNKIS